MSDQIPHAGDWTTGDDLKTIAYQALKSDGSPFDLTGHTAKIQGRSTASRGNKLDVAVTIPIPADGTMIYALGPSLTLGASQQRETYECQFQITRTSDSKKTYTDKFTVAVVRAAL